MKIRKMKFDGMDTFNDYQVELSFGQLVAIRNALEKDHADPLSDEAYAELNYYLQNIPGPGEDSGEFKAERQAAKKPEGEAGKEMEPGEAPPSETELEAGKLPAPPTEEEEGGEPFAGEEGEPGAEGFEEGPKLSREEREIIDRAMPQGSPTGTPGGRLPPPPEE